MNRRAFLNNVIRSGAACLALPNARQTKHLMFVMIGGGVRKKDYYEDASLSPNIHRLAREAYVFEQDHCERVASHKAAFAELYLGREFNECTTAYPTILDYIGDGFQLNSILDIPRIMQRRRPRLVVCREMTHEVGHHNYQRYLHTVKATDDAIGTVFDWVQNHPYFRRNTALVIRPEFGRDDDVNEHGHLHHSYGFYYTHRVASIFWGPDFNRGVDRATVINAIDMAPTLSKVFGVDAIHAQGRVVPGLFRLSPAQPV